MDNAVLLMARILGKRSFATCGIVTLLLVSLLAAVNLTSRFALKKYVEDQMDRLPWDMNVYQIAEMANSEQISAQLREVRGIERVETMTFLRTMMTFEVRLKVNGEPLKTTWLSILSVSDIDLLPPELRPKPDSNGGVTMALTGPEHIVGRALFALQGAKTFSFYLTPVQEERGFLSPVEGADQSERLVFTTPVDRVVRAEIPELNRWLLDRIGTISLIPEVGLILVAPDNPELLTIFDKISQSMRVVEDDPAFPVMGTTQYYPEVVHLARVDREALISGWDVEGTLRNLDDVGREVEVNVKSRNVATYLDNIASVLLRRVEGIARVIGLISLLISVPLLWIAWVLMGNLSGLLMLNERRKLGLMRLRGVPGKLMGRSLLLAIGCGCLLGGLAGLVLGTVVPLLVYEGGVLPWATLAKVQQPLFLILFLVVGLALVLLVSRRLIRYATTISPLEASRRVAESELGQSQARFGPLQIVCLVLGVYKVGSWVLDLSIAQVTDRPYLLVADRGLDFVGLPLFVYGFVALLASRHDWVRGFLAAGTKMIGGSLGSLFLKHLSFKTYRIASFLLIMALMASVTLYPPVMSGSFVEKGFRGAKVQMGTELDVALKATDLVDVDTLRGGARNQAHALREALSPTLSQIEGIEGVRRADFIVMALLPSFFVPGYGTRGVPLYLVNDVSDFLSTVYYEDELGESATFSHVMQGLDDGRVAVSPTVAEFWDLAPGTDVLLGEDSDEGQPIDAAAAGIIHFLPGMSSTSVGDRDSFVSARVDYLNHIFATSSFLVAEVDNPQIRDLNILVPEVLVKIKLRDGSVNVAQVRDQVRALLPATPLAVKALEDEAAKVGSDMFIYLALENMRIYLVGGLLLAIIAILSVALVNYLEDQRNMALLRIRGASPKHILQLLCSTLVPPTVMGILLGVVLALVGGFGMTNLVWGLRQLLTIIVFLPTHLVVTGDAVMTGLLLLALLTGVILVFSVWAFRRTAREKLAEE